MPSQDRIAGRHARWPDSVPEAELSSQHGFVLYWRADMTALMTDKGELHGLAGHRHDPGEPTTADRG
jgi:hypothetical protein